MDGKGEMPTGSYSMSSDGDVGHSDNIDQMTRSMQSRIPNPRGLQRRGKKQKKEKKEEESKRLLEMGEQEVSRELVEEATLIEEATLTLTLIGGRELVEEKPQSGS